MTLMGAKHGCQHGQLRSAKLPDEKQNAKINTPSFCTHCTGDLERMFYLHILQCKTLDHYLAARVIKTHPQKWSKANKVILTHSEKILTGKNSTD